MSMRWCFVWNRKSNSWFLSFEQCDFLRCKVFARYFMEVEGGGVKPAPKATVPFSETRSLHGASPRVSEENETKLTVTFTESQTWKGPSRGSGNHREQFSDAEPEVSPCRIPARFLRSSSPAAAVYPRTQAIQLSLPSFSSPWGAPAEFLQRSAYRLLPFRSFTHTHYASFHKLWLTYNGFDKHLLN